jgi:beta-mannanase
MTPTAMQLMNSSAFWWSRIQQQLDYISAYRGSRHDEIITSAMEVLHHCQFMYLGNRAMDVMEKRPDLFPEEVMKRVVDIHKQVFFEQVKI